MKYIQSLTLMMAVMVYAAPTTPGKAMLKIIHEIAETLLHNESLKELNFKVPGVTPGNGPTCTKEFFCLAEKSLKTSTEIKNANLTGTVARNVTKLERQLIQYNNLKNVHCHLNTTWAERCMNKFLEDIALCSSQKINPAQHG